MYNEQDISLLLTAIKFSADKHRSQRRKGTDLPYINHPIDVVERPWRIGNVRDITVIAAAMLHDTVEDTLTTSDDVELRFGNEIRALVDEVSDDKNLQKEERSTPSSDSH
jgi:GTP diphosphokinase / guanosine-3',5'-bis(diphosphate) 3'-diphosphatase